MAARRFLFSALALMLSLGVISPVIAQQADEGALPEGVEVVAAGLSNPRGFAWDADGTLHIALAGRGGDTVFPIMDGFTLELGMSSSIAAIADGCATPLVTGLLSTHWAEPGWVWGAMDVVFLDGDLYVLISGAGPSWMSPTSRSGVYRFNDDGTMTLVADLSAWISQNPPALIPPDYNADGSLFDLEATGDALLVSEAVGGQLIRVTPDGEITRLADLSEGHMVPTGIAVDDEGNAYVGFETTVPYPDGASKVVKVTPDGTVSDAWTGLTAVTDVVMGPDGTLYAAEMSTGNLDEAPYLNPNSGRIVRQTGPDRFEPVVTDIAYPSNLGFDASGALYLTTPAFGPDAGNGQGAVIRIDFSAGSPVSLAELGTPGSTCTA
jgi:sugar lactone lactonase YvrE